MYSYTKLSPYSPCDEDCKVIVPWLALSHIQCTLKLAEVIGKSPTFSCMCKSSLIENSKKLTNGGLVEQSYILTNIKTLYMYIYIYLYIYMFIYLYVHMLL